MNDKVQEILNEVGKVIRGKDEAIELVMTAMLAKGDRKSTRLNSSHSH